MERENRQQSGQVAEADLRDRLVLAEQMVKTLPAFGIWATTIRDFETPYGRIGLRQAEVLYSLRYGLVADGPASPSMLADHFHVQPSAMTRVLNRLESSGYVERRVDQLDRRAQTIHVTARGEEISAFVEDVFVSNMHRAIARVPDGELASFAAHIDLLADISESLIEEHMPASLMASLRSSNDEHDDAHDRDR